MSEGEFRARVGTMLRGKWSLDRLIGIGGMAAVYAATHKIGRTDAIKLLDPEVAVSDEVRARFEQEAMAVNSIGHKGAVEIRDIDVTEDGTPFLVMELLEGQTLAERAAAGRCTDHDNLLRLVDELLDVLVAAHAKGIIHRDIKPENLFVQQDGSLKVLDFGIARVRDGAVKTLAGTMLGTVAYMPPEQIKGQPVDRRADLFGVGATMFRLLAGRPVHLADDEWQVGTKMLTEPAPPLHDVAPDVPERLCWIVDRALAFHRERRYPNAATMRADVRAARNGDDPPYAIARLETGDDPRSMEAAAEVVLRPTVPEAPPGHTPAPEQAEPDSPGPAAEPALDKAPGKVTRPQRLGIERTKRGLGRPAADRREPREDAEPASARDGEAAAADDEASQPPAATAPQPPQARAPAEAEAPKAKARGRRAKVATTDRQLPAFVHEDESVAAEPPPAAGPAPPARGRSRPVAPTDPQMPAFIDRSNGPPSSPPSAGVAEADASADEPLSEEESASEEPTSEPSSELEPPPSGRPDTDDGAPPSEDAKRAAPPRSRRRMLLILLLLVIAGAALAWWRLETRGLPGRAPSPPPEAPPEPISE